MATWLHLNTMGLYSRGFRRVASYTCFKKLGWNETRKKFNWLVADYDCYVSETQYLVRRINSKGYVWDEVFDTKEAANAHMKRILANYDSHKMMKY